MSSEFRKFSEAARMYAENIAVVDKMWELFKADISAFLDAVEERVQSRLGTKTLGKERTKNGCSWWIAGDEDVKADQDFPYIWFRSPDAQIVTPGILELGIYADGVLKPHHQQLSAMLQEIQLPKTCLKAAAKGGQCFAVTITYGGDADPIDIVAEGVWTLLLALDDAVRQLNLKKIARTLGS